MQQEMNEANEKGGVVVLEVCGGWWQRAHFADDDTTAGEQKPHTKVSAIRASSSDKDPVSSSSSSSAPRRAVGGCTQRRWNVRGQCSHDTTSCRPARHAPRQKPHALFRLALAVLLAAAAAASERRGSTSSPHHHSDDDDEDDDAEVDVVDVLSASDMSDCFAEVFSRRSRMLALLLVMGEVIMSCLLAGESKMGVEELSSPFLWCRLV